MDKIGDIPDRVIPSFHASESERVHKALSKLWERIKELESKAQSQQQPQYHPKVEPDQSIDDVQSKLLELQLKYTRKIIRERAQNRSGTESLQQNGVHKTTSSLLQEVQAYDNLDIIPTKLQKETQTSERTLPLTRSTVEENSMAEIVKPNAEPASQKHLETRAAPRTARSILSIPSSTSQQGSSGRLKTNPHSHYHRKLSDVPFIVGQSAGASHSLIANVQSIIGMMKTHNAGLCKTNQSSERSDHFCEDIQSFDDIATVKVMKKELKRLAKELSDLTVKQESLKQKLENTNQNNQDHIEAFQEYHIISKMMVSKAKEIVDFHKHLKNKSGKTSLSGSCPEMTVTPQRDSHLMHKELMPRGKTIEAGQLKTVSASRPARIEPSKQLQASDFVWVHYNR